MKSFFPEAVITGCMFHFGQSIFKNLVKCGLKEVYANNSEFRTWFKKIFTLCLIPIDQVKETFEMLKEEMITHLSLVDFLCYFKHNYINSNGIFPIPSWNQFENLGKLTNNDVEGDNGKMKCYCGAAKPCINKAVELLQQYDKTSQVKHENA